MTRLSLLFVLALFASETHAQEWQTAKVLGAETRGTENVLAVQLGDLAIVASYTAKWSVMGGTREGRRASDLIVGGTVQARVDGSKLHFVMPNGTTMRANIVRRQLVAEGDAISLPTDTGSVSQSSSDEYRRMQQEADARQRCFQRQQMEHGLGGPVPNASTC
jgi:hypothetical protein